MQGNNIQEVIHLLTEITEKSVREENPMGYFAALYNKVTKAVKAGIEADEFENGPRMEKLDVIFANRYLQAYSQFHAGEAPTLCWKYAFEKSSAYWPIVLQHLLFGMHAHINLDLGISAARVAPGPEIDSLENDFNRINDLLAGLVGEVQNDLSKMWPTLRKILKITGRTDDFLVNFSMKKARDGAWKFAKELAPLSLEEQELQIASRDQRLLELARLINHPGVVIPTLFKIVRLGERGNPAQRIEILAGRK